MTLFNEAFCTEDFDQKMLDWISQRFKLSGECNSIPPSLEDKLLIYGTGLNHFWTDPDNVDPQDKYKKLTKHQFKEKIGMTNTDIDFSIPPAKDILEAGKHMIITNSGDKYLYLYGDSCMRFKGNFAADFQGLGWDLLQYIGDIDSVWQFRSESSIYFNPAEHQSPKLVWDRESYEKQKEDQEKALQKRSEYDKLMQQIDDLKKQAEKLK